MVVGKAGADGEVGLIATVWSVHEEFGGGEGVLRVELKEAEVESALKVVLQVVKAVVELQIIDSFHKRIFEGLFVKTDFLLFQPQSPYFLF